MPKFTSKKPRNLCLGGGDSVGREKTAWCMCRVRAPRRFNAHLVGARAGYNRWQKSVKLSYFRRSIAMNQRTYCRKLVLNVGDDVAARRQRYQW